MLLEYIREKAYGTELGEKMITFALDSNGKLKTIDFPQRTYNANAQYNENRNTFGKNNIVGDSLLFAVDLLEDGRIDEHTVTLKSFSDLMEDEPYPAYFYNLKADRNISAALVEGVDSSFANSLAVLDGKSTLANDNYKLTFYQGGRQQTCNTWEDIKFDFSGLKKGDAFLYSVNESGEMNKIVKVFDWTDGVGSLTEDALNAKGKTAFVYGIACKTYSTGFDLTDASFDGDGPFYTFGFGRDYSVALFDVEVGSKGTISAPNGMRQSHSSFNDGKVNRSVYLTLAKLYDGDVTDVYQIHFRTGNAKASYENQFYVLTPETPGGGDDGAEFVVKNGVLTKYNGEGGDVEIPAGLGIGVIGDSVFSNRSDIFSVSVPEGVWRINYAAFGACENLHTVSLPEGLTYIGGKAFNYCYALANIALPSTLAYIESGAFNRCESLTALEIPKGVTAIRSSTFTLCAALEAITIPDGVTDIAGDAFVGSANVVIYGWADSYAETYAEENGIPFVPRAPVLADENVLAYEIFNNEATVMGFLNKNNYPAHIRIAETLGGAPVTAIGAQAFMYDDFKSVSFPEGLKTIGERAFAKCQSLESATFAEGLQSVGEQAFYACYPLQSLSFPESLRNVGKEAFSGCGQMEAVVFSEGLQTIGESAFFFCRKLTSVNFPESLRTVGDLAFYATALERVYIPSGLESLGTNLFIFCNRLTAIDVSAENAYYSSLDGVLFNKEQTELLRYPSGRTDASYNMPASVARVGDMAFYDCAALESATLPEGLQDVGRASFYGCRALWNAAFPENLETIGNFAFSGCASLASVTLSENLRLIGESAFSSNESLQHIFIPADVENIGAQAFAFDNNLTVIEVAEENAQYSSIDGVLFDKTQTELLQYPQGKTASAYEVPADVAHIGDSAFFLNVSLESVTLPEGLQTIGRDAFFYCAALKSISLPEGTRSIGSAAFFDCDALTYAYIPASVASIGRQAFDACDSLTLYVRANSAAELYAEQNRIPFVALA
jgi:hypothetical protein